MAKKGGGKWWVMTPARKAWYASKKKGKGAAFAKGYKGNLKSLVGARKRSVARLKSKSLHPEARKEEIKWLKDLSTPKFRKSFAKKMTRASLGVAARNRKK